MEQAPKPDSLRETEGKRLELLKAIGAKRQSVVVAYLTSTRPGAGSSIHDRDIEIIESHVRQARLNGARAIDLFLTTYGGDGTAPWSLVAMVREYFKDAPFRVIVPADAYSAGSAIALGADEIVMGPASVLGPVDSQVPWHNGHEIRWASASDLQGFLDLVGGDGAKRAAARAQMMQWLTARADALAVGAFYRLWKEDRRHVFNLLESRRPPLSRAHNDRIARFMLYDVGEHGQAIRRTEARANGLSFITDLERTGLDAEVVALFNHYADILKIRTPFARPSAALENLKRIGDEADYDATGAHISETPIAIVESEFDTNPAYVAYGLRHWGVTPPIIPKSAPASGQGAETDHSGKRPVALWATSRAPGSTQPDVRGPAGTFTPLAQTSPGRK